jgi:hypothetical protein
VEVWIWALGNGQPNRAVLYGSLTVMVAVVYLAVVGVARWLFGMDRSLAVQVLATVLAAAALWPLRDRVQRRVDRLFYGDRGAPYEALAEPQPQDRTQSRVEHLDQAAGRRPGTSHRPGAGRRAGTPAPHLRAERARLDACR